MAVSKKTTAKKTTKKATRKVAKKSAPKKRAKNTDAVKNAVKTDKKQGRGINPNSLANLQPFKPGQSGNPKGKERGKRNFDTLVDLAIQRLAYEFVEIHNSKIKSKKKHITIDDVDIEGDIFARFLNKARNGDQKAIDSFLDRRFGKAKQTIDLTTHDDRRSLDAQVQEAEEEMQDWEAMWFDAEDAEVVED